MNRENRLTVIST